MPGARLTCDLTESDNDPDGGRSAVIFDWGTDRRTT